ncbi:MAG TPA: hypothetical protein PLV91_06695 [Verrucomicrobiota bacterium]|nr:hypothetical protein [Verrucomicrobiota bacterium]
MKWFKKKLESNPLTSEKRRLDTELQEIERQIQEVESARKKKPLTDADPIAYAKVPIVRTDAPNHFDPLSGPAQSASRQKLKAIDQKTSPTTSTQDPVRGRINLWSFWANISRIFSQNKTSAKSDSSADAFSPSLIFDTKKLKRTRREMKIIRRRLYLLIAVFLLIVWGVILMFLKH